MGNLAELGPMALILLAAVAIGGVALWEYRRRAARREALFAFATTNGMQYARRDPLGLLDLPFKLFRKGDGRGIENVVWGTWQGRPFHAFDYWYYTESTDSNGNRQRSYTRFTCAYQPIEGGWFPPLRISPENMLTRLKDKAGFRDLDFESDEFNRAFEVQARDRQAAHAVIDARMMSWLLEAGTSLQYELVGNHLLVATRGRGEPEGFRMLHLAALSFIQRIPDVAYELYGPDR